VNRDSGSTPLRIRSLSKRELESINSRERRYEIGQLFTLPPIATLVGEAVADAEPEPVLDPGVGGGVLLRAISRGPASSVSAGPAAVALYPVRRRGTHEGLTEEWRLHAAGESR